MYTHYGHVSAIRTYSDSLINYCFLMSPTTGFSLKLYSNKVWAYELMTAGCKLLWISQHLSLNAFCAPWNQTELKIGRYLLTDIFAITRILANLAWYIFYTQHGEWWRAQKRIVWVSRWMCIQWKKEYSDVPVHTKCIMFTIFVAYYHSWTAWILSPVTIL